MKYTYKSKRKLKRSISRKRKGVGKSLATIISELKEKGKYDEWVSKGSYFAYRSDKLMLPLKYRFIDMNGNQILAKMQSKVYRSDLEENIPIFGQIFEKDPNFVDQGTFRTTATSGRLITSGLATCSGLSMTVGKQKFLTHLDATTDIQPMITTLLNLIETEGVSPTKINIYPGNLDSRITLQLAKDIITGIGATLEGVEIHNDTCMMHNVIV